MRYRIFQVNKIANIKSELCEKKYILYKWLYKIDNMSNNKNKITQ